MGEVVLDAKGWEGMDLMDKWKFFRVRSVLSTHEGFGDMQKAGTVGPEELMDHGEISEPGINCGGIRR